MLDVKKTLTKIMESATIIDWGGNYAKWSNGMMLQWGVTTTGTSSINGILSKAYKSKDDFIVFVQDTSGNRPTTAVATNDASHFTIYFSGSAKFYWLAIGWWK